MKLKIKLFSYQFFSIVFCKATTAMRHVIPTWCEHRVEALPYLSSFFLGQTKVCYYIRRLKPAPTYPLILLSSYLLVFSFSGCSINRIALKSTSSIIQHGLPSFYKEGDIEFAKQSMPANLKLIEMLIENDDKNNELLETASQGFCGYSFMFVEDESQARASYLYEKGANFALSALKNRKIFSTSGFQPDKIKKENTSLLFWYAFCRTNWINLNRDVPEAIAELPKIIPMVENIETMNPEYHYNGIYAILGTYYSIRPKILGGNPEKSKEYFEKSMANQGAGFLLNKFMYAKTYAVQIQDIELFEKLLNEIINTEIAPETETTLANQVAKQKAKNLLEKKDELF